MFPCNFSSFRLIGTSCGTNGHPISPLLFCLGLGPPVKSESGFTSHVQTEEACDGSPFSHFLLFGTFCLLGTSLRLIGTRLSGKMLLHT